MEPRLKLKRLGFYPGGRAGYYYRMVPAVVEVRELTHDRWSVEVGLGDPLGRPHAAPIVFPSFEAAAVWMITEGLCPEVA